MSHKTTVAIADDHPIFREGVRRLLLQNATLDFVGEAGDGEAAVRLADEKKPDVMLLDFTLPGYSGLEVLRRMHEAGSRTKVLFLTAGMDRAEVLQALELGARGVVMKDAAAELLGKAITCILAGEYWIGREVVADWFEYSHRQRPPRLTLTERERDITDQILTGKTNREIGAELGISEETVKRHIRNIYDKLGVSNRMELALYISSGKLEKS